MEKEKLIGAQETYTPLATNEGGEESIKRPWWQHYTSKIPNFRCIPYLAIPRRYVVATFAFLGFCNVYSLRVNLSVAIVAMTSPSSDGSESPEFEWNSQMQGFILSTFFYGYIVTQILGGWLANRYGGKKIFGFGLLATSILCLMTPIAVRVGGAPALIAVRIMQGLAEGVVYPAMHAVWAKWSPIIERSRLATIAFSGSYVGTVISLPVSGLLAQNYGWPSIFYTFGFVALIWTVLWLWTIGESPSEDKRIEQEEVTYITSSLGPPSPTRKLPWGKIITSKPVWAINAAHFAENWGFYTLLTFLPRYMKDLYGMEIHQAGFISALPYVAMALTVQGAGILADYLRSKFLSTTYVRKIFTCGAFVSQTIFMLASAYAGSPAWAIACLTVAVGLGGFAWAGFSVNHLDLAPHYASLLMGISNTFATLPGMISPTMAGRMVQNGSAFEWREVFSVSATIYMIGAIVYGVLASGEQQPWAKSTTHHVELSDSSDSE